jgi:hypothetical protein
MEDDKNHPGSFGRRTGHGFPRPPWGAAGRTPFLGSTGTLARAIARGEATTLPRFISRWFDASKSCARHAEEARKLSTYKRSPVPVSCRRSPPTEKESHFPYRTPASFKEKGRWGGRRPHLSPLRSGGRGRGSRVQGQPGLHSETLSQKK